MIWSLISTDIWFEVVCMCSTRSAGNEVSGRNTLQTHCPNSPTEPSTLPEPQSPSDWTTGRKRHYSFILLYVWDRKALNETEIVRVRRTLTSQEWAGATSRRTSSRRAIFSKYVSLSQLQPYIQRVIRTNLQHMSVSHVYCGWYPTDVWWCSLCTQIMFA